MSKLLQAIEVGNVSDIQSYLKAYITGDPTDSDRSIQTGLKQIEMKGLPVWEQHDGTSFNTNKSIWTQDYFVDLQVDLRMNFSKERFIHMLEVGKVAFPMTTTEPKQPTSQKVPESKPLTQSTGTKSSSSSNLNGKKDQTLMYGGIAAVAVVILAIVLIKMIKND